MLYAKVSKKGRVLEFPLQEEQVRRALSNVSLPRDLSKVDLTSFGYEGVEHVSPPLAKRMHRVQLDNPVRGEDGKLVRTFKQVPIEPPTEDQTKSMWRRIRENRLRLLRESDWTQLPDAPLDDARRKAWADYRTELRNITRQGPDPSKVKWPTPPTK